ncbi:hypothetical protein [Paenibacillus sp. OV219]|uniref:hypothetical protein n=1 Tax=Paenibacillus sp. OV219 TaxID=1884377 RepID=UPI0008D5921A|nr:hypothetical protein [Paenibacillus sp. OV219]SEO54273.1 hypothetical protein SAMN05518847_108210 [Paenibacillus sp. OV219]
MKNRRSILALAITMLVLLSAVTSAIVIHHGQGGRAPVVVDPHEIGFNTQDPYFAGEDELNRLYDQVRGTGAQWVRATLFWDMMEQFEGSIDWTQADLILDTAAAKGLKLVLVIRSSPSWAADGADTSLHNYIPSDGDAYGLFCYEVAKRYLEKGVPLVFELGNEENMQFLNMPEVDAAQYTRAMLIPGSKGIRRAAMELGAVRPLVLVGGFAPVEPAYIPNSVRPLDFMQAIYDNGGQGYFDSIAYHPYTYVSEPSSIHWTFSELASLVDLMNSHGDTDRKIWATEVGWATGTGEGEVSEADQAQFTSKAFDVWYGLPYAGPMLWYELVDNASDDDANRENKFGLLHSDANWTPKPAYDVFVAKVRSYHVK